MDEDWRQAKGMFAAWAGPPVIWLLVLFLIPMVIIGAFSFGEDRSLTEIAVDGTLRNYTHALQPLYLGIIAKSVLFAALTTALCLMLGFPVAVAIAFAPDRAKGWLLLAIMLPFWTNLLIRTYALMAALRTEGYVNAGLGLAWSGARRLASLAGGAMPAFQPLPLLHNSFAVVLGLVYVQLPFMVLPLYAALDRLDRSLIEASLDLGAGHLATFRRVVIPLALPGVLSGAIVTFIPSVGAYLTPDLLGGPESLMIANIIERQFKAADNWPFGAALSFLLIYLTFFGIAAQGLISRRRRRPA